MKTSVTALVLLMLTMLLSGKTAAQEKKYSVSFGYGFLSSFAAPNLRTNYLLYYDTVTNDPSSRTDVVVTDIKIKPVYIKFDYRINERTSAGLSLTYNGFRASGTRTDSLWQEGSGSFEVYNYATSYTMDRFRILATLTRHFYVDRPKFNTYFTAGIGFNYFLKKALVDGKETDQFYNLTLLYQLPVSMRLAYGIQYHFSPAVSMHSEIGLGGPPVTLGLSFKF